MRMRYDEGLDNDEIASYESKRDITPNKLPKEMEEMNKAFEDFSKKCDETIKACQDFIDMDIKTSEPTLEPSVKRTKMATQRDEGATI
jgi:hypothetical protein